MKTLAVVIASGFNLLALGNACAHGDHESTHGGTVGRGDDAIVVEFVMEKGTINLYVHDEAGKPLATENLTGTLTLIAPQRPAQEVVSRWAHTLADDRFDLLKKIASEMAKAKGLKLPPKVAIVPSLDSSPQSRLASAARLPTSGNEIRSLSSRRHAE